MSRPVSLEQGRFVFKCTWADFCVVLLFQVWSVQKGKECGITGKWNLSAIYSNEQLHLDFQRTTEKSMVLCCCCC